jgi:hypothetical protein
MYRVTLGLKARNPQVTDLVGGQGQNRTGSHAVPTRGGSSGAGWFGAVSMTGGQGQNRTADTRIFSPLLYRLSYLAAGERRI